MYDQIIDELRRSYDRMADDRDGARMAAWKMKERQRVLSLFQKEGKKKLLEIGAGAGGDAKFTDTTGFAYHPQRCINPLFRKNARQTMLMGQELARKYGRKYRILRAARFRLVRDQIVGTRPKVFLECLRASF